MLVCFSIPGHPHFFNQLSCGLDVISMAGEWLTATANTNMFTYEIAPVFILMENVVFAKMREIIGWNGGDSILAPGKTSFQFDIFSIFIYCSEILIENFCRQKKNSLKIMILFVQS